MEAYGRADREGKHSNKGDPNEKDSRGKVQHERSTATGV